MEHNKKECKLVFNMGVARALLKAGATVVDCKPDKVNPDKTVLIMKNMSSRIRELTRDYLEVCHTVAESMEAEQKGEKKSAGLLNRLKKYRDEYNAACQYAAQENIGMDAFGYYNW